MEELWNQRLAIDSSEVSKTAPSISLFHFFVLFCFLFLSFTLTKSMLVPNPPPCWLRPIKKPSHLKKFQPVINRLLWKREFYIANSNFHLMTSAYRSQIFGAFFFSFPLIASSPSDRKPLGNSNNQSRHTLSVCTVCVCRSRKFRWNLQRRSMTKENVKSKSISDEKSFVSERW